MACRAGLSGWASLSEGSTSFVFHAAKTRAPATTLFVTHFVYRKWLHFCVLCFGRAGDLLEKCCCISFLYSYFRYVDSRLAGYHVVWLLFGVKLRSNISEEMAEYCCLLGRAEREREREREREERAEHERTYKHPTLYFFAQGGDRPALCDSSAICVRPQPSEMARNFA